MGVEIVAEYVADLEKNLPEVYLSLNKQQARQARQYKPGQMVKVLLTGKIKSQNFSSPEDPDKSGFDGSLCIETTELVFKPAQENQMAELMDEEDD